MRTAIGFVLLAVLAIAGAWWLAGLPGTVSASISGTTLTTSTPMALLLLAALFAVVYAALRLLAGLLRTPDRMRGWRAQTRRTDGDRAVTKALIALAAGDGSAAQRAAENGRALLGDTPLTLLLSAQASRQAGREAEAERAFKLLADRRDGAFLGLRGLLRQATARGDWTAAAALASRADAAYPGAAWVREERLQLAQRSEQWGEALRLAPQAAAPSLAAAAAIASNDPGEARSLAKRAWKANPKLSVAAVEYARRLREAGKERVAQDVLRQSWTAAPHPDIAASFLSLISEPRDRLRAAPWLIRGAEQHPESHLLLARLALDAGSLSEARRHAEAARDAGLHERRVYTLLADIAETEGDRDRARDALRMASDAEPDAGWRCEACATPLAAWAPVCPACSAAGRVNWVSAPAQQLQLPRISESRDIEGVV